MFPDAFVSYQKLMGNLDFRASILTVPYVMLAGPVAEELIFRGVILDRLKPAFPFWVANVMQAALFGFFHLNVIQGLYAFVLGILLGMVVRVTGSIIGSMITHIIFNATSIGLSVLAVYAEDFYRKTAIYILTAAVICFILGFRYYVHQYHVVMSEESQTLE